MEEKRNDVEKFVLVNGDKREYYDKKQQINREPTGFSKHNPYRLPLSTKFAEKGKTAQIANDIIFDVPPRVDDNQFLVYKRGEQMLYIRIQLQAPTSSCLSSLLVWILSSVLFYFLVNKACIILGLLAGMVVYGLMHMIFLTAYQNKYIKKE